MQAVLSHQGGATQVEWSTRNDNGMQYLLLKERGKELSLPLPGVNAASFGYLDKEGRLYEEWPPRLGLHDHLPAAIVLKQEMDDGSERLWAADIAGARATAGPGARLGFILRPTWPHVSGAGELAACVAATHAAKADRISFYNYGHMRLQSLDWIARAL